jgi:hypothetical protein
VLKNFLVPVIILLTFQTSVEAKCEKKVTLSYKGKDIELCYDKKLDTYKSLNCSDLKKCFFKKEIKLQHYQNQSPGFSLCFQLNGDAFFGDIKGVNKRIPMCKKDEFFANHEALLLEYYRSDSGK